ncbi:MAG: hypothetical protein PHV34_03420 [Verrucomicrobiae bacterium]|nr:hypothetical protein [Verrucomicrobiae bacterium]
MVEKAVQEPRLRGQSHYGVASEPILRYRDWVELKAKHLARSHPGKERTAQAYRRLLEHAQKTVNLPEKDFCDLAVRVADLIWYENAAYAKKYLDLVKMVFSRDTAEQGFAATRAVIWNLARVMLIKDEIYVAHLLTSEEKLERDRRRYGVDPARGDRLRYVHINRPHFEFGPVNLQFDLHTYNWQLGLVKRCRFLRRWAGWHPQERDFRDWYMGLLPHFRYGRSGEYGTWLSILRCPEEVRGYAEVRRPKQEEARRQAELALAGLPLPASVSLGASSLVRGK